MSYRSTAKMCSTLLISASILMAVTACTPRQATRGNLVTNTQIEELQAESIHKADVMRILGTPSSKAIFDDNIWYYVGMRTEQSAFLDPKVTEKHIYTVSFDDAGMMIDIAAINHKGYNIPISDRETPTTGQDITVLQQILGNVGKFNPQARD